MGFSEVHARARNVVCRIQRGLWVRKRVRVKVRVEVEVRIRVGVSKG